MILKNLSDQKATLGSKDSFRLPTGTSCRETFLPSGRRAYIFHDVKLGQLGRLVTLPHQGRSQWLCEVFGRSDDPLTQKRREIFTPIVRTFLKQKDKTLV